MSDAQAVDIVRGEESEDDEDYRGDHGEADSLSSNATGDIAYENWAYEVNVSNGVHPSFAHIDPMDSEDEAYCTQWCGVV